MLGRGGEGVHAGVPRLPRGGAGGPGEPLRDAGPRHRARDRRGGRGRVQGARRGHTRWCNGNTFYDGFTTALTPNTRRPGIARGRLRPRLRGRGRRRPDLLGGHGAELPPRRRQRPARRRQRPVRQENDRLADLAGARLGRRRRGRLVRRLLNGAASWLARARGPVGRDRLKLKVSPNVTGSAFLLNLAAVASRTLCCTRR